MGEIDMHFRPRLRDSLILHEGFRDRIYKCTAGKWTIGFGRNLQDRGITREEGYYLLHNDLKYVVDVGIEAFPWISFLNLPRQDVIFEMIFQLGVGGVSRFKKMIQALRESNYEKAANEMIKSKWYEQTPERTKKLATMMRMGVYL